MCSKQLQSFTRKSGSNSVVRGAYRNKCGYRSDPILRDYQVAFQIGYLTLDLTSI